MEQGEFKGDFRYKRQPPETEFYRMEAILLDSTYDLVEHMQQVKQGTSRDEIVKICDTIDRNVERLRDFLRDVKAETKQVRGGEPLSQQTAIHKAQQ